LLLILLPGKIKKTPVFYRPSPAWRNQLHLEFCWAAV
jgi:hypothetical protein